MEGRIMKKAKIRCPYFILLVVTSILFGCLHILKGNDLWFVAIEEAGGSTKSIKTEGISGEGNAVDSADGQWQNASVSGNENAKGDVHGNSVSGNSAGKIALDTEEAVQSYLSETLFIGDSRTATLHEYSGWDAAHFYVKNGLTIWDVLDETIAEYNGEKLTVDEALQKQKFKRIYVMLGINELGRGTPETFAEQYKEVIARIKQLQPEAVIIVEAIMHVTEEKDAEETYINNAEINARNEKLKEMAEYLDVYWLDVNEVTDNKESNCLVSEYSFDGVHLKVKYLDVWKKFILENPF